MRRHSLWRRWWPELCGSCLPASLSFSTTSERNVPPSTAAASFSLELPVSERDTSDTVAGGRDEGVVMLRCRRTRCEPVWPSDNEVIRALFGDRKDLGSIRL